MYFEFILFFNKKSSILAKVLDFLLFWVYNIGVAIVNTNSKEKEMKRDKEFNFKKIVTEVIALILLVNFVLYFEPLKSFVYSDNVWALVIQSGMVFLCLGLALAGKLAFIEEIVVLILEVLIYWLITWTNVQTSVFITTLLAPITGAIAAVIFIYKNIVD